MLLSMMANTGVINCYGVPRDKKRPPSALPVTHRRYRGQVYVEGAGEASLQAWSPNGIEVAVRDAEQGAVLVYNMNHREGWRSDVGPVKAHRGLVSVAVPSGGSHVRLWYRPPRLGQGVGVAALTIIFLLGLGWRERRWRSHPVRARTT